jgi:hypothetical protein
LCHCFTNCGFTDLNAKFLLDTVMDSLCGVLLLGQILRFVLCKTRVDEAVDFAGDDAPAPAAGLTIPRDRIPPSMYLRTVSREQCSSRAIQRMLRCSCS